MYSVFKSKLLIKSLSFLVLLVVWSANAQINLETTVIIDPEDGNDICGTEHSIVVDQGTPIKFCFKATNTGPHPYSLQDLSSPYYGNTLLNFPYILQPGASVWITESEDVSSTVVVDGTWTAHNDNLTPRYKINTVSYDFDDISTTGTNLNLSDDGEANVTLDFDFSLGGIYSDIMTVGNNGAIRFGEFSTEIHLNNVPLASTSNENFIAPFWDDLIPTNTAPLGRVYYETIGSTPNRVAIIQWSNQEHINSGTGRSPGTGTFEVKLFETTNEIQFHYQDVTFGDAADNGETATVGVGGDSNASQFSYNQATLSADFALSFTRPESVGYIVTTSDDFIGPAYNFVDISSTGTALNLGDDDEAGITMDFDFFLSTFSSKYLTIGNNGAVRLGQLDGQILASNTSLATDKAQNIIAPFWDDLSNGQGNVYYQTFGNAPFRTFIVQWDRPHYISGGSETAGTVTFEMKLFETQNKIEFHYQNVDFDDTTATNTGYDFGKSATVGIGGGIHAAQFSYNDTVISNNMAIQFTPSARRASGHDSANVIVNSVPDIDIINSMSSAVSDPNPTAGFNLLFDNLGTSDLIWSANDCGTSVDWLTLDGVLSGTLAAGTTGSISILVDANGLDYGAYTDDICIDSNDPDEATKVVLITMRYKDKIFKNGFE